MRVALIQVQKDRLLLPKSHNLSDHDIMCRFPTWFVVCDTDELPLCCRLHHNNRLVLQVRKGVDVCLMQVEVLIYGVSHLGHAAGKVGVSVAMVCWAFAGEGYRRSAHPFLIHAICPFCIPTL